MFLHIANVYRRLNHKPRSGMFWDIFSDYLDMERLKFLMIGDSKGDMEFVKNCR